MKHNLSEYIKQKSIEFGFDSVGISVAQTLHSEAIQLEKWLNENRNGAMHYMENHFEKRINPKLLVEDCQSIISLAYNYFPEEKQNQNTYKIAKYAFGEDYHFVIKEKLRALIDELQQEIGAFSFRIFVDSAPVLEKAWAKKSGLGWIGKNTNLLMKAKGSFFFLAEIFCDLKLEQDTEELDHCGTCTQCIDSCPTQAIYEPYKIDGSKCISYFTIELKDEIPETFKGKFEDWMFGCDICQDVCPWNRFSIVNNERKFKAKSQIIAYKKEDWKEMTEEIFNEIFKKSAVKRTKFSGLKRNILFLEG